MPTIQELIGDVQPGEILLPEFQRGYVWKSDQVRGLVQSLYRKHPTGHLLTWKTSHPTADCSLTSVTNSGRIESLHSTI